MNVGLASRMLNSNGNNLYLYPIGLDKDVFEAEEIHNGYIGFLREYPEYDTRKKLQSPVKKDPGDKEVILQKKKMRGRPRKQRTLAKESNSHGDGILIFCKNHFEEVASSVFLSSRFFQGCI